MANRMERVIFFGHSHVCKIVFIRRYYQKFMLSNSLRCVDRKAEPHEILFIIFIGFCGLYYTLFATDRHFSLPYQHSNIQIKTEALICDLCCDLVYLCCVVKCDIVGSLKGLAGYSDTVSMMALIQTSLKSMKRVLSLNLMCCKEQ